MWQVGFEPSGEESGGGDAEGGDDEEWQADALLPRSRLSEASRAE